MAIDIARQQQYALIAAAAIDSAVFKVEMTTKQRETIKQAATVLRIVASDLTEDKVTRVQNPYT